MLFVSYLSRSSAEVKSLLSLGRRAEEKRKREKSPSSSKQPEDEENPSSPPDDVMEKEENEKPPLPLHPVSSSPCCPDPLRSRKAGVELYEEEREKDRSRKQEEEEGGGDKEEEEERGGGAGGGCIFAAIQGGPAKLFGFSWFLDKSLAWNDDTADPSSEPSIRLFPVDTSPSISFVFSPETPPVSSSPSSSSSS